MKYAYTGDAEQVYPQYLDAERGSTLVAAPGEAYAIAQVEGLTASGEPDKDGNPTTVPVELAMPPDANWKPVTGKTPKDA